jgi:hypothetical protein
MGVRDLLMPSVVAPINPKLMFRPILSSRIREYALSLTTERFEPPSRLIGLTPGPTLLELDVIIICWRRVREVDGGLIDRVRLSDGTTAAGGFRLVERARLPGVVGGRLREADLVAVRGGWVVLGCSPFRELAPLLVDRFLPRALPISTTGPSRSSVAGSLERDRLCRYSDLGLATSTASRALDDERALVAELDRCTPRPRVEVRFSDDEDSSDEETGLLRFAEVSASEDVRLLGGRCLFATGCSDSDVTRGDRGGANGVMDLSVLTGRFIQVETDKASAATRLVEEPPRLGGRLLLEGCRDVVTTASKPSSSFSPANATHSELFTL